MSEWSGEGSDVALELLSKRSHFLLLAGVPRTVWVSDKLLP